MNGLYVARLSLKKDARSCHTIISHYFIKNINISALPVLFALMVNVMKVRIRDKTASVSWVVVLCIMSLPWCWNQKQNRIHTIYNHLQ